MYEALNVKKEDYVDKMMCAGGIQGYSINSSAVEKILKPVIECCMKQDCIEPPGAATNKHRYDQSAFSIMLAKNGIQCQTDAKYWANRYTIESSFI